MKSHFLLTGVALLFLLTANVQSQGTKESQILAAREATLITVAEVVHLGEPLPALLASAAHVKSQVAIFKVRQILKGTLKEQFIKVKMDISIDKEGVSKFTFRQGNQLILLLKNREDTNNCFEAKISPDLSIKINPSADSAQYSEAPCYSSRPEIMIEANDKELDAVKWLVKATRRS
jgi:hypothetical protein